MKTPSTSKFTVHPGGKKAPRISANLDPSHAEGDVDTSQYYVAPAGPNGDSARVAIRFPAGHAHLIRGFCASEKTPFKDPSAFIRWAISEGIKAWVPVMEDPDATSLHATLAGWVRQCGTQMQMLNYTRALEELQRDIEALLRAGHEPPARKRVNQIAEEIDRIPDAYWRGKFEKEILRRFEHLLDKEQEEREEE